MDSFTVDGKEIVVRIIKYILEGAMVAIAAYLIPAKKPNPEEILTIALVAAATFSLLDMFLPSIYATGARATTGGLIAAGFLPVGKALLH
jgi:ABC-type Co2+ transport system permease subunit